METIRRRLVERTFYFDCMLAHLGERLAAATRDEQTFGRPNGDNQSATKQD
jgi:hypothetical protein